MKNKLLPLDGVAVFMSKTTSMDYKYLYVKQELCFKILSLFFLSQEIVLNTFQKGHILGNISFRHLKPRTGLFKHFAHYPYFDGPAEPSSP